MKLFMSVALNIVYEFNAPCAEMLLAIMIIYYKIEYPSYVKMEEIFISSPDTLGIPTDKSIL